MRVDITDFNGALSDLMENGMSFSDVFCFVFLIPSATTLNTMTIMHGKKCFKRSMLLPIGHFNLVYYPCSEFN